MTLILPFVSIVHSSFLLPAINREMAQLALYASTTDKYLVFNGVRLHKKGFLKKGKVSRANAALVAGVLESELSDVDADVISTRMAYVRRGSRVTSTTRSQAGGWKMPFKWI